MLCSIKVTYSSSLTTHVCKGRSCSHNAHKQDKCLVNEHDTRAHYGSAGFIPCTTYAFFCAAYLCMYIVFPLFTKHTQSKGKIRDSHGYFKCHYSLFKISLTQMTVSTVTTTVQLAMLFAAGVSYCVCLCRTSFTVLCVDTYLH